MDDDRDGRAATVRWFGPEVLLALEHVWVPTWVFDVSRFVFHWVNQAALGLWGAASREELLARDFSSTSETARIQQCGQVH